MADSQVYDMENGLQQDSEQQFEQQNNQMNSEAGNGGVVPADSGSAKMPGRDDDRKLFVGGISWNTTDKELREYFRTYGHIESINVKIDIVTGRSRGYAFIVFSQTDSVDKILSAGVHIINNNKVDTNRAKARQGKIFVGGLVPELSDDDIKSFFSQFGTIVEVDAPLSKRDNQRRGYCFITFESRQVAQELLKTPIKYIKGKSVEVKKVIPKPDEMGKMRRGRGGRGVQGRGQGGYGGYGFSGYGNYGGFGGYGYTGYGGYGKYAGYGGYGKYAGYGGYGKHSAN